MRNELARSMRSLGLAVAAAALLFAGACSNDTGGGNTTDGDAHGAGAGTGGTGGSGFGELPNASIAVTPAQLLFNASLESTAVVQVKNTGDTGVVHLQRVYLKEGTSPHFSVDDPGPVTIEPLQFIEIGVHYQPGPGVAQGALVLEHDALNTGPIQVPLSVSSTAPAVVVLPQVLDFGEVPIGVSDTLDIAINNTGSAPFRVAGIALSPLSDAAFAVATAPDLPADVSPNGQLSASVRFEPTAVGQFEGELVVTLEGADKPEVRVTLRGAGISGALVAEPGVLDFGVVAIDDTKTLDLTVRNKGAAPVDVAGIDVTFGTDSAVSVVAPEGAFPTTLQPGDSTQVKVEYAPTEPTPTSNDPIGGIAVLTGPQGDQALVVPVFGNVAVPDLVVSPPSVDFGLVASGATEQETVSLFNAGFAPLVIDEVKLTDDSGGEFVVAGWQPTGVTLPWTLQPEESIAVVVAFTNTQGEGGVASGQLVVHSNDATEPSVEVPLSAARGGKKECKIALEPPAVNYGIVPIGHTKTLPVTIRNVGTGPCTFKSASTYDCSGLFGLGASCSAGIGNSSKYFKIIGMPPPIPGGLPQNGELTLHVMFVPPSDILNIDFLDSFQGALQVTVTDPSNGNNEIAVPPGNSPEDLSPNLIAQAGFTDIGVIPGQVDFGLVTVGCTSQLVKITVFNNGNASLVLSDIKLADDCSPEFEIVDKPAIPPQGLEVTQGTPVEFHVIYKPQVDAKAACTVEVISDDSDQPLLTVPLEGEGTFDTERTDEFTQSAGQEVDILFVVDNSGSMSDNQQNLADNFDALIQEAQTWGTNYHLGVVTTDMDQEGQKGRLQGTPRWVEPGPNAAAQFKSNVKVGDNGDGSQESGLEAAYRALSPPLSWMSNASCQSDADCGEHYCWNGLCGGYNAGFLRDDAQLEIVFVSDEEDQSPAPVSFYIDFLKSIKGFANDALMHAHAIVGDKGSGCSTSAGEADAGNRYIAVAEATGGKVGSICDASFASILSDIGKVAFGLKVQFFLSAQAVPSSVQVWVGGNECAAGWTYDQASNSVIFDENGPCMPQEGEQVLVHYKILCLQEG